MDNFKTYGDFDDQEIALYRELIDVFPYEIYSPKNEEEIDSAWQTMWNSK